MRREARIAAKAAFSSPLTPAFTLYTLHYTLNKKQKDMKKVYLAPQTETIHLISENVIMATSGGVSGPTPQWDLSDGSANAI